VRVHTSDGRRELTLMFLEPGDVFSTHTGATLTAAGAVELLAMPTRHFARALEAGGTPAVISIMRVLGRLLAHTVERLEDLVFRDVHARLACLLLALVRRQGCTRPRGHGAALALHPDRLAGVLGTSRQSGRPPSLPWSARAWSGGRGGSG
jgi:CRP-like cAMP-binding protein